MSFKYAMTDRNARVDASRSFSSSRRESSAGSGTGLGIVLSTLSQYRQRWKR